MSLKELYETHRTNQAAAKRDVENLRREALMSTSALTEALTDSVNAGVVDVFENQKKVEDAARELSDTAGAFKTKASAWARDLESFDKELRAIGDFENWVKAMEHDLATLAGALEDKVGAAGAAVGKKK